MVIGAWAMLRSPVERYPNIHFGKVYINTYYPGASPRDVEALVTGVIEDALDDGTPEYPFPDWETFVVAYGDSQVLDPYGNPRPAALEFWNTIKRDWGGSCFGFTSVSLHLFGNTFPYDISDWGVESSIYITVSDDIRRLINAEQIRQPYYSTYLGGGTIPGLYTHSYYPTSSDASSLINDLENNMVSDLQNLCFFVWGWGGHSITPYKLDTISIDEYRIYCYDNWSAYYDFYFDVNTSTGDIVYHRTHFSPSSQNVDLVELMPSRPFAQPPVMDFYSGSESKDIAFAGTGNGVLSVFIRKQSTGDSSYFSIDTLYGDQILEIRNNNIWTEDAILAYYATNDSVSEAGILTEKIKGFLDADAADAYFIEPLTFGSVPETPIARLISYYEATEHVSGDTSQAVPARADVSLHFQCR